MRWCLLYLCEVSGGEADGTLLKQMCTSESLTVKSAAEQGQFLECAHLNILKMLTHTKVKD